MRVYFSVRLFPANFKSIENNRLICLQNQILRICLFKIRFYLLFLFDFDEINIYC